MKTTLFAVDAFAGNTRHEAAEEINHDYLCSTVLAMTDNDTCLLTMAIHHIECGEPLKPEEKAFLSRLSGALGQRRCEGNNVQALDDIKVE